MGVYGILTYIGAMKRMDHTHTHQKFREQIVVADKPEITILFLVKNHEIYSDIVVSSPMKWLG